MRRGFEEHLKVFGEDFQVGEETKRAVFSDHKGVTKITFAPIKFALKSGDILKRVASDEAFRVISTKTDIVAGIMVSFEAVVLPI